MSPFDASLRGGHTPGVATDDRWHLQVGNIRRHLDQQVGDGLVYSYLVPGRVLTKTPKFGVQDSDKGERDFCD